MTLVAHTNDPSALKAYTIREPEEGFCVVVHARNGMEARRLASGTDGVGGADEYDLEYERASAFDGLEGDELIHHQILMGWWYGCFTCERRVCIDDDEDDEDVVSKNYVVRKGNVYCCSRCCIERLEKDRARRRWEWKVIETVTARWPGTEVHSLFENVAGEAVVYMKRPDKDHETVEAVDLD